LSQEIPPNGTSQQASANIASPIFSTTGLGNNVPDVSQEINPAPPLNKDKPPFSLFTDLTRKEGQMALSPRIELIK
jgi:hypothetical protein